MRSGTSSLSHVSGPRKIARIKLSAPHTVPIKHWYHEPGFPGGNKIGETVPGQPAEDRRWW